MFRRIADRVGAAIGTSSSSQEKVEMLRAMGFDSSQARNALQVSNGDVDRAAELLLASSARSFTEHQHAAASQPASNSASMDREMQSVMQASLQAEEERIYRQTQEASLQQKQKTVTQKKPIEVIDLSGEADVVRLEECTINAKKKERSPKTAAAARAGNAAVQRAATKPPVVAKQNSLPSHPNVKVPAKLQDKSKEEQVLRNAQRLKPYPAAVDTLYKALKRLQDDPSNDKFRKIDQKTAGYKRTLDGVPGAEALLTTMNFSQRGDQTLVLERHLVDPALLYLGVSALEGIKETTEYLEGKRKMEFAKEIERLKEKGEKDPVEAKKRAEYASKCPSESSGRGALMNIVIGDETVRRKFDSDDVLRDVINWIGSQGSIFPEKILSRDWSLVDLNHFPISPVDCEVNMDRTLQYLGFWPSGRLEVRPSTEQWKMHGKAESLKGSSRGLGAVPKD
jgi:hypothetical protein